MTDRPLGPMVDLKEAIPGQHQSPKAFLKEDRRAHRIAIVVSGSYWEFFDALKALIEGFSVLGWADPVNIPENLSTTAELLAYLKTRDFSKFIEFPQDLYFDLNWGETLEPMTSTLIRRASTADLVIALGGIAGTQFSRLDTYSLPVLMDSITDPLSAGVIKSIEDSGKDFITCRTDPERYKKQVRLFHDTVDFKTLGIVYGETNFGRIYGAVKDVEAVAAERGFQIIRNTRVLEEISPQTPELYLKALEDVCRRAEAVYLGASHGLTEYPVMDQVVRILKKYKKPSFALEGSLRVKQGVLFSISMAETTQAGIYNANKIVRIFSGDTPRSLPMVFPSTPSISINMETAKAMGYKVPLDVLAGADQIFMDTSP